MYKRILVPLDGSELSESIMAHVKAIAEGCGASEVVLLRVLEPLSSQVAAQTGDILTQNIEEIAKADAADYLSTVAGGLKQEIAGLQTTVLWGKPADEILDYVGNKQVDIIIMSTHGRSGVSRWVFGSVADRVIRHSPVPVLVVPPPGARTGDSRG